MFDISHNGKEQQLKSARARAKREPDVSCPRRKSDPELCLRGLRCLTTRAPWPRRFLTTNKHQPRRVPVLWPLHGQQQERINHSWSGGSPRRVHWKKASASCRPNPSLIQSCTRKHTQKLILPAQHKCDRHPIVWLEHMRGWTKNEKKEEM